MKTARFGATLSSAGRSLETNPHAQRPMIAAARETWVVVYARGNERNEAPASCKEDALASVHLFRKDGWTAWAELRSRA